MIKNTLRTMLTLFVSLFIALTVSGIFIALSGENPFGAYFELLKGAFFGKMNIITTLRWTMPYVLAGIAAAVSFKAGLFNMGLEGCIYIGGLTAAVSGAYITGLPPALHLTLCLLLSMAAGALWLLIPSYLKAYYGVNEVIFTWMLSYIAILLCQFIVAQYFQDPADLLSAPQQVRSAFIQESAALPKLIPPYQLNASMFIVILLVVLFFLFSSRTKYGYEHKMLGTSMEFSRYGGVDVKKTQFFSLLASGAIGSLVGATEIMGIHGRYIHEFSKDMGANGILVALMGKLSPVGIPIAGFFMGSVQNGARAMVREKNVSLDTIRIFVAVIVICITADGLFKMLKLKKQQREGD